MTTGCSMLVPPFCVRLSFRSGRPSPGGRHCPWIAACEMAGVIALYEDGGKPYGQMAATRWTTRSEPKCPLPPWGKSEPPYTTESGRLQVFTPVPVFGVGDVVGDGDVLPKTRRHSEANASGAGRRAARRR
jgi:hypothetical protein